MKRTLALLLTVALLLPLAACGGGGSLVPEETGETATAIVTMPTAETEGVTGVHDATGFCAGLARYDITPTTAVPLSGYGNPRYRISTKVLDPIYVSCVAVRDEGGETILLFQFDLGNAYKTFCDQVRSMVIKATGVPDDHIFINMSHSHSVPDPNVDDDGGIGTWKVTAYRNSVAAAKDAIADLDVCTMEAGATKTDRLNFVRRYYRENGFVGDGWDTGTGDIIAHETETDEEMRLVRFVRKNQKDIVLANWQCHNHRTGGSAKTDLSSDFVGIMRDAAEKKADIYVMYLQGGGGNINPSTRIPSESRYTEYHDIGRALADHLCEGLDGLQEVATGKVSAKFETITAAYIHDGEEKLEDCQKIQAAWSAGDEKTARALCAQYGLSSPYEATAVIARAGRGESGEFTVYCASFGDVGLAAAPFEMFCQTYQDLRARSPFTMTLTLGYTNDALGYQPAADCYDNLGYEVVTCRFVKGTAEQIEEVQLRMLSELKAK